MSKKTSCWPGPWNAAEGYGTVTPSRSSATRTRGDPSGCSVMKTRPSADTAMLPGGESSAATVSTAENGMTGAAVRSGNPVRPPP